MADSGQPALRRRVGLFGATVSGVGVIVGAGVYALIGEVAGIAGGAAWAAFLLAAVVAGLTGASYARMGRRIPKDSPEFQYVRAGLGFRAGFLAGWLMLWADLISAAAVALGFGGYLHALVGVPTVVAGLGLVAALSLVAWAGIRESLVLVTALVVLEVGGLVVVAVLGVPHWGEQPLLEMPTGVAGIWTAGALVFFAYIGFDELGNLAEEMKRPERDLPLAVGLAVAISTALYVLVAVSAVSLVGWSVLAGSSAPLAAAVEGVLGAWGWRALGYIALAATASTVLLLLVSASRSLYGMSNAGALPGVVARVGGRGTPWVSTLLIWGVASLFLLLGDIALVAKITNFTALASFTLVNVSLWLVLRREPQRPRTRRIARATSILQPILGAALCVWLAAATGWLAIGVGVALGGAGLAIRRWLRPTQLSER